MTMIDQTTITRNTVIETVDRLIDECSHTCANLMLRFQTKDGREIRSNARQFYGMLHSRYAAMSWLSDVTMIRLFVRGQRKAIAAAAVPVVDTELAAELAKVAGLEATIRAGLAAQFGAGLLCTCGQEVEYEATGRCYGCHTGLIDITMTQYEASYRQGAL